LSRDPEWPFRLYVNAGYSGHGFVMTPLAGSLLARSRVYDEIPRLMKLFLPTRFKEKRPIKEVMVIG